MKNAVLVQRFLEQSAERFPGKVALICDGRRLTYAELDGMANKIAHALQARGLSRGDRVIIYLPNCVEAVISIFAVLKAGGVFVVVNSTTKFDKLAYILNNCQATAFVTSGRQAGMCRRLVHEVPSLGVVVLTTAPAAAEQISDYLALDEILRSYSDSRLPTVNIDLDLACLIYTSGTTGDPKGVMSDHSNVVFAASSIIEYLQNAEDDIVIDTLPISFDYGLYQILMVFKFGGTLILEKGFSYPASILKRMEDERVTGFPGVPTMFALLLQMDTSQFDLSSLRYITNTAAVLPPSHILEIRKRFPRARVYSMYGLTETKRTLYLPPDLLDERSGSVGIAIPGSEVWLEDEEGRRLGPGEVGELVVRGRHVMRGYWGDHKASSERYRPGPIPGERVCYTGDLFRMDDDGYMYFMSRKDDIIKSRGEKISPKEVENVLYALPGVVEAAVIGVSDELLGQAVKALLVVQDKRLDKARVLAHCRANLENLMVPEYIEFVDELAKTSSGKIKKSALT